MAELSELHRQHCDGTDHVPPVGEYEGQPYNGQHGEPLTGGLPEQCMCGHHAYYCCPDWGMGDEDRAWIAEDVRYERTADAATPYDDED